MASAHFAQGRRALALVFVALCSIVATGCLHGDVDVTVNSDGSGQVVVEVFPNRKMQDELEDLPIDIESLVEGSFEQVEGFEFSEIEDGDRTGYRFEVPFDDYRDVEQVLVDGGTLAGQQVQLFSSLTITESPDDGGWSLDATILPLGQAIAGANAGMVPESMRDVLDAAGIGNSGSGLDLSISLPGTIVSSNASSTSGGTATWRLDEPEAPTSLQMRTEPTEFPTQMQLIIGGAALAVVLGLVLFIVGATRTHKSAKQPRRQRARRARETASGVPDAGWAAPPVGTVPSPESNRPEELPVIAPSLPPTAVPPLPPTAGPPQSPADAPSGWQPPTDQSVATEQLAWQPPTGQPEAPAQPDSTGQSGWQPPTDQPVMVPPPASPLVEQPSAVPPAPVDVAPVEQPLTPPTPAGWYPDPDDASVQRWWSGTEWTEHRG